MELLVVITIIGILIALLLPAVQAAREAARKMQCSNNIKQLALACLTHEQAHGHFPVGGWGHLWTGDPDCGFGLEQPGGWYYNILPYVELDNIRAIGAGLAAPAKKAALGRVCETTFSAAICPSRRPIKAYTNNSDPNDALVNADKTPLLAHGDYAGNAGDVGNRWVRGPESIDQVSGFNWLTGDTGIFYQHSKTTTADVQDGLSNTYLIGEKYLWPDHYEDGLDWGDDGTMYAMDCDIVRWGTAGTSASGVVGLAPKQDQPGVPNYEVFGSAHSNTWNAAFCDGSVQSIGYSIDLITHQRLCNRNDQQVVDSSKL